jgi:Xaa-Pro aminopeptidase
MAEQSAAAARTESHDPDFPEAFLQFMRSGWRDEELHVSPRAEVPNFAKRRAAVSSAFPGETLIIPSGNEKVRANDTEYPFRPGSDFFYLTGDRDPDSVLVLHPTGGGHEAVLYTHQRNSKDTDAFFRSRNGELWVGRTHTLGEKSTDQKIVSARAPATGSTVAGSPISR